MSCGLCEHFWRLRAEAPLILGILMVTCAGEEAAAVKREQAEEGADPPSVLPTLSYSFAGQ